MHGMMLTISRKIGKILTASRKSHHPIKTLVLLQWAHNSQKRLVWLWPCSHGKWNSPNLEKSGNRDLKQTTTATATRTWKNKRSNWQNNSLARAFENFVHFFAVLCKTTTWNHHNLRRLRTETETANYFNFHLELNASLITLCWSRGVVPYETVNTCGHFLNLIKGRIYFF